MSFSRSDASVSLSSLARGRRHRLQCALPEGPAEHRRVRDQLALERLQRVQAGREQALHGVGELGRRGAALLGDPLHHLLGEQGVASAALGERVRLLADRARGPQQLADQRLGVLRRQRFQERDRGRAAHRAPAGPAPEQLVPRQAHLQHRCPQPAGQVVDQVERALVGPVDVLPGRAPALPARPAPPSPRAPPRRSSRARPAVPAGRRAARARNRRRRAGARSARSVAPPGRPPRARSAAAAAARSGAHGRSPDRPLRRSRTRCGSSRSGASTRRPGRTPGSVPAAACVLVPSPPSVPSSSASRRDLPTPAWPTIVTRCGACSRATRSSRPCRRPSSSSRPISGAEERIAGPAPSSIVPIDSGLPGGDPLGLALQLQRLELVVVDDLRGQPLGALAHERPAHRRRRLQAGGHVDGVAEHRVGVPDAAGEHLARC